jgi:pantothenate kinase type III
VQPEAIDLAGRTYRETGLDRFAIAVAAQLEFCMPLL